MKTTEMIKELTAEELGEALEKLGEVFKTFEVAVEAAAEAIHNMREKD